MRKEKKNYLASLVVTFVWWLILAMIVMLTDPQVMEKVNYLPFFGVLFLAVLFSASLLLADTTSGLVTALGVVVYGYLKVWGIGNWFNTILLAGVVIVVIIYRWGTRKEIPDSPPTP